MKIIFYNPEGLELARQNTAIVPIPNVGHRVYLKDQNSYTVFKVLHDYESMEVEISLVQN